MNEQALASAASRSPARPAGARPDSRPSRSRHRLHVLVADEKGMIRDAICALLAGIPNVARVSSVTAGPDTLRGNTSLRPDVIILEIPRPLDSFEKLISALKREQPETRIIVLTFQREAHLIDAAFRAGADGYVLKKDTRRELVDALESVIAGKTYVSPSIWGRVSGDSVPGGVAGDKHQRAASQVSPRERQVIRLIAEGHRTREIAELLSVSYKTVEKHRTSIMRKLGLRNASAVAAYAIAHGFADG